MTEFIAYMLIAWTGYMFGYITGSLTGLRKYGPISIAKKDEIEEDLCTDYSHLKKYSYRNKHQSTLSVESKSDDSNKIYDVEPVSKSYKIDKII